MSETIIADRLGEFLHAERLRNRRLAMSETIIALDLVRHNSVACVYDRATRQHAFRTLDTTPEALTRLFARHPGALVVVEACANAGWCTTAPAPPDTP